MQTQSEDTKAEDTGLRGKQETIDGSEVWPGGMKREWCEEQGTARGRPLDCGHPVDTAFIQSHVAGGLG